MIDDTWKHEFRRVEYNRCKMYNRNVRSIDGSYELIQAAGHISCKCARRVAPHLINIWIISETGMQVKKTRLPNVRTRDY